MVCNVDNCVYGIEGHCGKSEFEYFYHCELLNDQNKEQRCSKINALNNETLLEFKRIINKNLNN